MRTFLIEKTPDLQFESDSTATLKINSLVLPDLVLNGTHILKFPIYLKPIHETSQIQNLELSCRLVPELIMAGVVLIGAFIDGDELVVAVNGNARLKEEMNDVLEDKKFILTDHAVLWIEKSLEIFYSEPKLITTTEAKKVQSMYESLCNAIFDTPKIYMTQDEIHMMI